jgi:hypothetical protein
MDDDPMTEFHPTATRLAKAEAEYAKARLHLSNIKAERQAARQAHRRAIEEMITSSPGTTNVDIAIQFRVAEGTIRNVRRELGTP